MRLGHQGRGGARVGNMAFIMDDSSASALDRHVSVALARLVLPLLLLACTAPVPSVNLPVAPSATYGEALDLNQLLGPTPFGANSDVLCPWARGETIAPSALARWVAEKRLVHRVLVVADPTTFAGAPLEAAEASADATVALEARCGATIGRDVLVAAPPAAPAGAVTDAIQAIARVGYSPTWILVNGPIRSAPTGAESGRATVIVSDPPQAFGGADGTAMSVVDALASKPACVILTPLRDAPWARVVEYADEIRKVPAIIMLAILIDDRTMAAAAPEPVVLAPATGTVAALPLTSGNALHPGTGAACFALTNAQIPDSAYTDDIFAEEISAEQSGRSLEEALNDVGK